MKLGRAGVVAAVAFVAVASDAGRSRAETSGGSPAIPSGAANCSVEQPPKDAGAYVAPGGFLLVHPRNQALPDGYTGCKGLWVVDAPDRIHRLMTLYFEAGKLRVAVAYDGRGETKTPRAVCTLPGSSPGCEDIDSNPLAALRVPTYPRACMDDPDKPECAEDPE
jgi:hypothetical protein